MTSSSGPQADRSGRSQGFRLRERAACSQLCWFPSDLRGGWSSARILRNRIPVESRSPPYPANSTEDLIVAAGNRAVKLLSFLELRAFLGLICLALAPYNADRNAT